MKKTILTENDYNDFYKTVLYGEIEDVIEKAILVAYRDLCRTIKGFSKNVRHDVIFANCVNIIYDYINIINKFFWEQEKFDVFHKVTCDKLISFFEDQKFTYGQAQKWINMSIKYVSMFNHKLVEKCYECCHVPIDNYILQITNYDKFNTTWSRITDYEEYLDFQKWFRKKYSGIPLDEEFYLWINSCKKERQKQQEKTKRKFIKKVSQESGDI